MNTDVSHIDLNNIDETELEKAREALNEAIDFYKRWYENNEDDYERFAKAISETYANLGTALKYSGEQEKALEAFRLSLLRNPDNSTAKRALELLDISPTPYIEAGEEEKKKHKKLPI
jgi:tetratricopeptide (TPR) repeat protein